MAEQLELFPEFSQTALDKAKEVIYGDREKTYGTPDKNLKIIAKMWSAYLEGRMNMRSLPVELNAKDVCWMMNLLKTARAAHDQTHDDNVVDAIGYVALTERCV